VIVRRRDRYARFPIDLDVLLGRYGAAAAGLAMYAAMVARCVQ
jgi:hypothetical protein